MAEDATVEESAPLKNRVTRRNREVDVVIRGKTAGQDVTVSVEASSTKRPASVEWVERMIGKHADLPTDKLVLVSEAGFREQAREYAAAKGVALMRPEDIAEGESVLLDQLRSIWPKTVSLAVTRARVLVQRPSQGDRTWVKEMRPDHTLFLDDGREIGTLGEAVEAFMKNAHPAWVAEQIDLVNIEEDRQEEFIFGAKNIGPFLVDEVERRVCVKWELSDEPEFHPIEGIQVFGDADIRVNEVSLQHRRLGDVVYAYGEGKLHDRKAVFVFTEADEGITGTIRVRDD